MLKRYGLLVVSVIALVAALSAQTPSTLTDWPQWRGPDRTGKSKETGLLKQWPPGGPTQLWRVTNLGAGYGSLAIKGDRIFVQMLVGRQSVVASLNRSNGQIVWSKALGPGGRADPRGVDLHGSGAHSAAAIAVLQGWPAHCARHGRSGCLLAPASGRGARRMTLLCVDVRDRPGARFRRRSRVE